jgi:hypothetical protein
MSVKQLTLLNRSNMAIKETLKLTGELVITVTRNGALVETVRHKNLVVDSGLEFMASRMRDESITPMSHMAVGSGTTPTTGADTQLGTELGRVAFSFVTATANQITYNAAFAPGVATGAVSEAGILNAGTAGRMLCRTVFPVVNKLAADSVNLAWTVTVTAA